MLRALLRVAAAVRESGHAVSDELLDAAREQGATDAHLHDTVLVAVAFAMFNRSVDGLGTEAPADPAVYAAGAGRVVEHGYRPPPRAQGSHPAAAGTPTA